MSLCGCVCVCLAPMQLSIIINFTSKCRPQTWQTVLPLLLLLLSLADKQIISTTSGGAKSLRHDIFPSLSPPLSHSSLSLFPAECCLCLALFKFNFKLQVASCQLPVANQSVRQPDCTTDTSVRSSLNQLGGAQLNDQSKPTQTLHFLCIKPTAATATKAA